MPTLFRLIPLLVIALLSLSCRSDRASIAVVEQVLTSVEDHPSESLEFIRSVSPESLRGDYDRARYALAYSEALYYNRIHSDSDTLVAPMMRYYIHDNNHHAERARALYQYALVMDSAEKYANALYYLFEAEKSLNVIDDLKLRALIYRTVGSIYGRKCLYKNALDYFYKAKDIIDKTELDYHRLFIEYEIGEILYLTGDYKHAENILQQVKLQAIDHGYLELLSIILHTLSDVYISDNRIIKCGDILSDFNTYNCPLLFELNYYYICAIYESYIGNRDESLKMLQIANSYPNKANVGTELLTYHVFNNLGDVDSALYWLERHTEQQEKLMLATLELPLINTQLELLSKEVELANIKTKEIRRSYVIVAVIVVVIISVILLYIRNRIIKQQHDIEEYMSIIDEMKTSNNRVGKDRLQQEIYELYGKPFSDINNLCEIYYADSSVSWKTSHIISSVKSVVNSIKNNEYNVQKLEQIVNENCNNILAEIKKDYPKLNGKEHKFLLYYLCGFSNRSICLLLDIDTPACSRLKYKIKDKIGQAEFNKIQKYR